MENNINISELKNSIDRFVAWLEKHGYESFDPYDIWGIPYSLWARRLYYNNTLLGLPFIAPILLIDTFIPGMRSFLVKKERFATADAQLTLAFLNLYKYSGDAKFLEKARALGQELLSYSIPGYSGYCWGYPFDWQNSGALWRKNTPFITATPYCFEAFLALYYCTHDTAYFDIAQSISRFVADDLKETPTGPDAAAGSYSPIDSSKVINASAYRAMVLTEASVRFKEPRYHEQADKNINFILQSQSADGSWLYEIDHTKGAFIDHFHTCFVLKNLYKINKHYHDTRISDATRRGFDYYRKALFNPDGTPRTFAVKPRFQIVIDDLYNYAEAITLCSLIDEEINGACGLAGDLAKRVVNNFQLSAGYFVTKVFRGGIKTTLPFIRWSQAQQFYALTNLLWGLPSSISGVDFKQVE